MKKVWHKTVFWATALSVVFLLAAAPEVLAYKLQIQLPGAPTEVTNPADYVKIIYKFGLLIVGLLAFGVIVYGGIEYMLSPGNESRQADARNRIEQALWGLGLLLAAYLILYTINPDLVKLEFKLPGGGGAAAQPTTQGQTTQGEKTERESTSTQKEKTERESTSTQEEETEDNTSLYPEF